ncbi:MAG: LamG-like jellyroll fold domain-containing protein [Bacteroidota bacterium]
MKNQTISIVIFITALVFLGAVYSTAQNKSMEFNGSSQYISNASSAVQSFATNVSFTVQFWAKRSANSAGYIVGQGTLATRQGLQIGFRTAGLFSFNFFGDSLDSDPITYDTKWHHYAVTFNSTSKARNIYMDGLLIKSGTAGGNYTGTGNVHMAKAFTSYFSGSLDEIKLYNVERTQSEIQASIGESTSPWGNLISYIDFSSVSGNYVYDIINSWTDLFGSPTYENPSTLVAGQPTFSTSVVNYNFGSVNVGSSPTGSFYVKNTGSGILNINSVSSTNARFTISPTTAKAIFAGDSVQYTVTFTPLTAGIQSGNIAYTHNASGSPTNFAVAGLTSIPSFTSFTPDTGQIGSTVTITGTNFNTTPANNKVFFGSTPASVQTATSSQLTVTVPLGAASGPITVETGGYVMQSASAFTITFTSNTTLTSTSFKAGTSSFVQIDNNSGTRNDIISLDVDRDGKLDLVVAGSNSIGIYRNIHSGGLFTTGSYDTRQDISLSFSPSKLMVADVDGDGVQDIIASTSTSSPITILRNTSTIGSFSFSATSLSPGTSNSSANVGIGDIDGDRKQDIVFAGYLGAPTYGNRLITFRNTSSPGTVSFDAAVITPFTRASDPYGIAVTDLDADGQADVAVIQGSTSGPDYIIVSVFRSTAIPGSISYNASQGFAVPPNYYYAKFITTADLNDDGLPDLICGSSNSTLSIFRNTSASGAISFAARQDFSVHDTYYYVPEISTADVTGDGKIDVIASTPYNSYVRVYPNTSSGTISFGTAVDYSNQISSTYWNTQGHAVTDGNLDGKPDIIVASSSNISIFENRMVSPQFVASSYNYSVGSFPVGLYKKDSINVTNNGGQTLTISSATSTNSADFSVTPTSATIANGSNQWFVINYHYNSSGTRTTKLVFAHNAANHNDTVNVSATNSFSTQANAGNMLTLNGSNQYVNAGIVTTAVNNITMEAWVYWNGQSGTRSIIYHGNTGASGYGIYLYNNAVPAQSLTILCGGKGWVTSSTQLPTNSWHHVAAVRDNGTWKMYLDGVEISLTNTAVIPNAPAGELSIASGTFGGEYFSGKLDEIRLWTVARTQAQIHSSYQSQAGNETGLAAYYRFDEGFGAITGDGSGNGKNVTLINAPTWGTSTAPVGAPLYSTSTSTVAIGYIANGSNKTDSVTISNTGNGVLNLTPSSNNLKLTFSPATLAISSGTNAKLYITFSPQTGSDTTGTITLTHNSSGSPNTISVNHLTAASFGKEATAGNTLLFNYDAYSDFASTPYSSALNPTGTFTYEVWARSDVPDYSYSGYIISSGNGSTGISIAPDNYGWIVRMGTGGTEMALYSSGRTQSVWYHLAVTYSGTTAKLYVNGVLKATTSGVFSKNTSLPLYVGTNSAAPWYSGFTGTIDEIRIWNVARTQEQIYADMTNSLYGNESGLAAYWRFDEGSGTTVQDKTMGERNLTLGGTNYTPTWQSSTAGFPAPYYNNYTASLSYGNVQTTRTKKDSFYVKNFGATNLSVSSVTSNNARYTIAPTTAAIASNDSGKFIVTFAPTVVQAENGTFTVTHNAYGSPHTLTVSGNGATANSSASPTSLAFGTVQVGNIKIDSVTISNSGAISLQVDSVKGPNSNYSISPTSAVIAASGSQKFYITFTAELPAGTSNGNVSFYHSAGGSPTTVSVTATKAFTAASTAGQAMQFNGSNSYDSVAAGPNFANSSFSVEFWAKRSANASGYIVSQGTTSNNQGLHIGWRNASTMTFDFYGSPMDLSGLAYNTEWHHWAFTYNAATNTRLMYQDGVQMASYVSASDYSGSGVAYVGRGIVIPAQPLFNGQIDELRIWNTARTQAQIQANYKSQAGNETGLLAYYRFDEGSGAKVYDLTGGGKTLSKNSTASFVSSTAYIGTPAYSATPSSLAFGSVHIGVAKQDSFVVTNTGGGLLNIGTITSGDGSYTISPSTAILTPSASQKVYVTFLPMAPAASHNTTLSLSHNASGSPNSISITGSGVFQAAANSGNGLTFTSTSKFIDIPSSAALSTANFTVELWMKIGATWQWGAVIDKGRNQVPVKNWYILTTNSSTPEAQGIKVGMQGGTEVTTTWGDNNWHHIALTYDGANRKLYVDGALKNSQAVSGYSPVASTIRIGGRQDTSVYSLNPFDGNIDEVRLWNVARTQSEIQSSYASLAGNETGLVSYLRFDESSGTTAYDASGNSLNGTIYNGLTRMIPSTAPVNVPVYSPSATSKNFGNIYFSKNKQDSITISNTGGGFLHVTNISSNNAQFTFSPDTMSLATGASATLYITATPTSLGTQSGTITLTHNASGSPSAISVQAKGIVPVITSFTPASGAAGTSVVILGSGFSPTPANNTVYFGTTKGMVSASTDTTITVAVPTGATYAPITVQTDNLQAHSRNGFIVKFNTSNQVTSGSFAANVTTSATANGYGMFIADIDNDGKPDLVTGNESSNGMNVVRNTSTSGSFSFATPLNFSTSPYSGLDVAVGDIDGDGKLDVLSAQVNGDRFSIFRNTSTSGSVSMAARMDYTLTAAHGSAIGDLDGDGKPEVVVANNSGNQITVYKNSSTPGTISISSVLSLTSGSGPREVHLSDFDGDGKLDIAAVCYNAGGISVFRNTSSVGTVSFNAKQDMSASCFGMAIGDLTGDGKPEIAAACGSGGYVRVFQNTSAAGAITFGAGVNYAAPANRTITIGDFSGDGKPDIASNSASSSVSILKNNFTSGTLITSSFAAEVAYAIGSNTWNLRSADLDGDGKMDIAAIGQASSSISLLRNTVPLPATFVANPGSKAFGSVNLGSSKTDSIYVKNTGGVALSVTNAVSTNAQYTVSPITGTVAIGDSLKFLITFTPTTAAVVNAKIVFADNTAAGSDTVSVSGTGTGPVISLRDSSKAYGVVLVSSNKKDSVYIKNTGNATLSVSNISSSSGEFTVSPTTFSINASDSGKLYITFAPTSTGTKSSVINIVHNGTTTSDTILVNGKGIHPVFSSSVSSNAFGNVGLYQTKTDSVTVTNSGSDTLIISSVTKSNAQYSLSPTSASLLASASQKFYVTYSPTAIAQANDTLVFTHNAGSITKIPLSGTGAYLPASSAGNAVDLNGSNQYADAADGVWFNGNFTIESWVYVRNIVNYARLMDFGNGAGSNNILVAVSTGTSGQVSLHVFQGTSSQMIQAPAALPLNTWNHIACVLNGITAKIFINGTEVVSGSLWAPLNVTRTLNYIGRSNWSDPYANMKVDEFRIWNSARIQTQIQSGMNASLSGNEAGLIGYFRFDESSGTTAYNITGSGNNAQLINSPSRVVSDVKIPGSNFNPSKTVFAHSNIGIGGSSPDTAWVKNYGPLSLQIDSVKSSNAEFTISPVSASVVSNDSVRIISILTPLTAGTKSSNITFYSNAFTSPNILTSSGTALSSEPTVRDSHATFSTVTSYKATIKWQKGDAENHLVIVKSGSAVDGTPVDGSSYSAHAAFGSGSQIGAGNYVVYNSTGDSVVVTNLEAGQTYHVAAFGYNGNGTVTNYFTPSTAVNSCAIPYPTNSPYAGTALSFDGSNTRYGTIPLSTPTTYTIEMWIKPHTTANQTIFARTDAGGPMFSYSHALDISGGKFRHFAFDGNAKIVTDQSSLTPDTWHHVAIVAVNGGMMRLYVNGNAVGTPVNVNTLWTGGDRYIIGYGAQGIFNGSIDELRVWNSERTVQQIRENMHRTLTGNHPGLISYLQFNEGSGSAAADSIHGNDAALVNAPAWVSSNVPVGSGVCVCTTGSQSGSIPLGNISLNLSDDFDAAVDLVATELSVLPNTTPEGYSSVKGNRYFILNAYGSAGTFLTQARFTLGSGIIDPRADFFPGGVQLFKRESTADGAWTEVASADSARSETGEVWFSGISSFSQFVIVEKEELLPVEISSFSGFSDRLNAELRWTTATEWNNYGFEIERRTLSSLTGTALGGAWTKGGFVEGSGTSSSPRNYSFKEKLPAATYAYRLKQIDGNGAHRYSVAVTVEVGTAPAVFTLWQNYPNPFNPVTTIEFTLAKDGLTTLTVYDLLGREVATLLHEERRAGTYHQVIFNARNQASGVYFVRLRSGESIQLKKMMLVK